MEVEGEEEVEEEKVGRGLETMTAGPTSCSDFHSNAVVETAAGMGWGVEERDAVVVVVEGDCGGTGDCKETGLVLLIRVFLTEDVDVVVGVVASL